MKNLRVFLVVFAVFCLSGCEEDNGPWDITFQNNCDFDIKVKLSESNDTPQGGYTEIKKSESYAQEGVEKGSYYILLIKSVTEYQISKEKLFIDRAMIVYIEWGKNEETNEDEFIIRYVR